MKLLKKTLYALAIVYFPCLLIFPLLTDQSSSWWQTPYGWSLFMSFLLSFPFYLAFIKICFIIGRISDKKEQQKGERTLNIISAIIALGIVLTAIKISSLLYVAWGLSVVLIILWVVGVILFKRRS